jgi:hypothetical protein
MAKLKPGDKIPDKCPFNTVNDAWESVEVISGGFSHKKLFYMGFASCLAMLQALPDSTTPKEFAELMKGWHKEIGEGFDDVH